MLTERWVMGGTCLDYIELDYTDWIGIDGWMALDERHRIGKTAFMIIDGRLGHEVSE